MIQAYKINSDLAYHLDCLAQLKFNTQNPYGGRALLRISQFVRDLRVPITELKVDGSFQHIYGIGEFIDGVILNWLIQNRDYADDATIEIKDKFSRDTAGKVLDELKRLIQIYDFKFVPCGSWRREKDVLGDLDVITDRPLVDIRNSLEGSRFSVVYGGDYKLRIRHASTIEIDVLWVENWELMSATFLLHATGSSSNNIRLRTIAQTRGWTLSQYGLFNDAGIRIPTSTEAEVYEALDLEYCPPEIR